MCQYCEEDRPTISCDFTIVDSEGHMTRLQKKSYIMTMKFVNLLIGLSYC